MTRRFIIKPAAERDLLDIVAYIGKDRPRSAERFKVAAIESIRFLAETPGAGPTYRVDDARFAGLRKWAVKGFRNYLMFYLVKDDSIVLLRVIHGARDIPALLEDEEFDG